MAKSVTTHVAGLEQVVARINSLDRKLARKIVAPSCRAGAKIPAARIKQNMPVGKTGRARRGVKVKPMKRKRGRIGYSVITSAKSFAGKFFYPAPLEYGHKVGKRQKGFVDRVLAELKDRVGRGPQRRPVIRPPKTHVEGRRTFRDAFASTAGAAKAAIENGLRTGIDQAIRQG